ncbi:carbohydrate-binding family 9-like protein [candidate division KSB1 bacterium]|nr:carbohydrate-binding family 9-like protein [candidate division KSB1 bacterium]
MKKEFFPRALFWGLLVVGLNGDGIAQEMKQFAERNAIMSLTLRPRYTCNRAAQPLLLTGRIDDPQWQKAEWIDLVDAVSGKRAEMETRVKCLYDDRYLYVAFICEDSHVWGTHTRRDEPIFDQECVEVFLNPADTPHHYYEINLSPKNVVYDTHIINNRTPENPLAEFLGFPQLDFKDLHTAVWIDGQADLPGGARGWRAEFAIPLAELFGAPHYPPRPGDRWRVNFYRIDSPRAENRVHFAWSPTGREAFHLPWRFGELIFAN